MSESEAGMELEEPVIEVEESGDGCDMGGVDQGEQIPPLEEGPKLRRSTRECQPSTRYPSLEYILIADGGRLSICSWFCNMRSKISLLCVDSEFCSCNHGMSI